MNAQNLYWQAKPTQIFLREADVINSDDFWPMVMCICHDQDKQTLCNEDIFNM